MRKGQLAMHYALKNHILRLQIIPLDFWYRILVPDIPVGSANKNKICHINWEPRRLQTKCLFPVWFGGINDVVIQAFLWISCYVGCAIKLASAGLRTLASSLLTLNAPNKNCRRRHFNFLLLSLGENKAWVFFHVKHRVLFSLINNENY